MFYKDIQYKKVLKDTFTHELHYNWDIFKKQLWNLIQVYILIAK